MRRPATVLLSASTLVALAAAGAVAAGGSGTVEAPPRIAFLANGQNPADALAAGSIAGQLGAPLYTTPSTRLDVAAKDGIVAYAPDVVLVLGGPAAIADGVVTELATATGLTFTTAKAPETGIARVAGENRYLTAKEVAELRAAYPSAFLPVGATALGAVDADTIEGRGPSDFASSGQQCPATGFVIGITPTGGLECENVEGEPTGEPTAPAIVNVEQNLDLYRVATGSDIDVQPRDGYTLLVNNDATNPGIVRLGLPIVYGGQGLGRTNVRALTVCAGAGADNLEAVDFAAYDSRSSGNELGGSTAAAAMDDDSCETFVPDFTLVVDGTSVLAAIDLAIAANSGVSINSLTLTTRPTDDNLTS